MDEIALHIYMETSYTPVTVGAVLTEDGWVCIDTPPMPRDAQEWRDTLRAVRSKPVLYVINTDHHRDRILGNGWFDAPVIAHQVAAQQMLALKAPFITQAAEEMSANDNDMADIASARINAPQVSFTESLTLFCGGREIVLTHRPSASISTTWVTLAPEKVLFAGDSMTDNSHPTLVDGTSKQWLNALAELRRNPYKGWKIVPGRGAQVDSAAVERLYECLKAMRRQMINHCRAGRPRSEIAGLAQGFMDFFSVDDSRRDEVQQRIRTGLETIYEEIRAHVDSDEIAEEQEDGE